MGGRPKVSSWLTMESSNARYLSSLKLTRYQAHPPCGRNRVLSTPDPLEAAKRIFRINRIGQLLKFCKLFVRPVAQHKLGINCYAPKHALAEHAFKNQSTVIVGCGKLPYYGLGMWGKAWYMGPEGLFNVILVIGHLS